MLKTKVKADNKVKARMVSKGKVKVPNRVKDKAMVKEVTVVECLRKCKTSMTVTSRLSMIWPMHNRIKDKGKVMVSPIS